jgi:hypothetical protein
VGSIDLDAMRALLGFGPVEGEAWFHLPEKDVGFAPQKSGTRALLLRTWGSGPLATVYPRTRSPHPQEPFNPPHTHQSTYPKCWLRDPGWIVTSYPIPVDKGVLNEASRLCSEEHGPTVAAVLKVQ